MAENTTEQEPRRTLLGGLRSAASSVWNSWVMTPVRVPVNAIANQLTTSEAERLDKEEWRVANEVLSKPNPYPDVTEPGDEIVIVGNGRSHGKDEVETAVVAVVNPPVVIAGQTEIDKEPDLHAERGANTRVDTLRAEAAAIERTQVVAVESGALPSLADRAQLARIKPDLDILSGVIAEARRVVTPPAEAVARTVIAQQPPLKPEEVTTAEKPIAISALGPERIETVGLTAANSTDLTRFVPEFKPTTPIIVAGAKEDTPAAVGVRLSDVFVPPSPMALSVATSPAVGHVGVDLASLPGSNGSTPPSLITASFSTPELRSPSLPGEPVFLGEIEVAVTAQRIHKEPVQLVSGSQNRLNAPQRVVLVGWGEDNQAYGADAARIMTGSNKDLVSGDNSARYYRETAIGFRASPLADCARTVVTDVPDMNGSIRRQDPSLRGGASWRRAHKGLDVAPTGDALRNNFDPSIINPSPAVVLFAGLGGGAHSEGESSRRSRGYGLRVETAYETRTANGGVRTVVDAYNHVDADDDDKRPSVPRVILEEFSKADRTTAVVLPPGYYLGDVGGSGARRKRGFLGLPIGALEVVPETYGEHLDHERSVINMSLADFLKLDAAEKTRLIRNTMIDPYDAIINGKIERNTNDSDLMRSLGNSPHHRNDSDDVTEIDLSRRAPAVYVENNAAGAAKPTTIRFNGSANGNEGSGLGGVGGGAGGVSGGVPLLN